MELINTLVQLTCSEAVPSKAPDADAGRHWQQDGGCWLNQQLNWSLLNRWLNDNYLNQQVNQVNLSPPPILHLVQSYGREVWGGALVQGHGWGCWGEHQHWHLEHLEHQQGFEQGMGSDLFCLWLFPGAQHS